MSAPWTVEGPQYDNREGFSVFHDGMRDYDFSARVLSGADQDTAEFAAMLLNNDGLGDLSAESIHDIADILDEALVLVECVCGELVRAASLSMGGECAECLS